MIWSLYFMSVIFVINCIHKPTYYTALVSPVKSNIWVHIMQDSYDLFMFLFWVYSMTWVATRNSDYSIIYDLAKAKQSTQKKNICKEKARTISMLKGSASKNDVMMTDLPKKMVLFLYFCIVEVNCVLLFGINRTGLT